MGKFLLVIGRIFLSLVFLIAVVHQFLNWNGTEQFFIARICDWLSSPHLPLFLQDFFTFLLSYASLIMILHALFAGVGGLLVLLGIQVRLGAVILILFLIPTTLLMHCFWFYEGAAMEAQMTEFLKNLGILGGLFILASSNSGASK